MMKWFLMVSSILLIFSCTKVKVVEHQIGGAYNYVYVPVVKKNMVKK